MTDYRPQLQGRRVLITGAARGIGALTAKRLTERGAQVALAGIEPDEMAKVAADLGGAPTFDCDVTDRAQVETAVAGAVEAFGGLDIAIANAGVAAQLALIGGNPAIFEKTMAVNVLGAYYLARAAGEHVGHPRGYLLVTASAAAAVHPPLMGAYSASKAAVEALGNTLRIELAHTGCKVGVAYYAELDTDMTSRGFGTEAATKLGSKLKSLSPVSPVSVGIDALEAGIAKRSRRIVAPRWVGPVLHSRMIAQRVVERQTRKGVAEAVRIARTEDAGLTTSQD